MPSKPAYVVVINWNGREHLETCLDSLKEQTYDNLTTVLVDNGSTDGSVEFVTENYAEVAVLAFEENLGFCGGNNKGMEFALDRNAEYVMLLNNDTRIAPDCVENLVRRMEEDSSIGALACKMLLFYSPEIINSTGVELTCQGVGWDLGMGRHDSPRWNESREVAACSGGACMIRAEALRKVGLFPNWVIYYEDVDLSLRIWNAGYRVVYEPKAVVYHKYSATMGKPGTSLRKWFLSTRNRYFVVFRQYPVLWAPYYLARLAFAEAWMFVGLRKDFPRFRTEIWAVLAGLVYIPVAIVYRLKALVGGYGTCRFWKVINKRYPVAPKVAIPEGRELRPGSDVPSELPMDSTEQPLGGGWYPVDEELPEGSPPGESENYRWIGKSARTYLTSAGGACELHVRARHALASHGDIRVAVKANGNVLGVIEPKDRWETYRVGFESSPGVVTVELEADRVFWAEDTGEWTDYSIRVARVGLASSQDQSDSIVADS